MPLLVPSAGGALAVRLCHEPGLADIGILKGLVVVDIVEGTALDLQNMAYMHKSLSELPCEFASVKEAVEWSVHRGIIKNEASAEISVPAQLKMVCR